MASGKKGTTQGASQQAKAARVRHAERNLQAQARAKDRKGGQSTFVKVLVAVFAAIMALTMMLPSLSAIFADSSSSSSTDSSSSSSTDSSSTVSSVSDVDDEYSSLVDSLKSKLDSDPSDLAAILNVGNDYFNWAYAARSYASSTEEKAHVTDLFDQAISYYDQYLSLNDSKAVHVDRALCQFYAGDTDGAIAALEEYTATVTDYGPAWANLGMMYENDSRTDDAKAAYTKAVAADPDDTYGAKTYATERLSSIEESESSSSSSSSSSSLSSALANASGTTL